MSFLESLAPLLNALPEVKRPDRAPGLKERLMWTGAALLLFFFMGQIFPIGVDQTGVARFERLEILMGSKMGTLITAGIGPIVLASIFLQLAVGAGMLSLDLSRIEHKRIFQGLQKFLAIAIAFVEAIIYVMPTAGGRGYIPIDGLHPLLGSIPLTFAAVAFQLALGSIILLYLDEIVQKYGIGSGISLFIAAGVTQAVFVGALSFASLPTGMPAGLIPQAAYLIAGGDIVTAVWTIMPIAFTVIVFLIVVYAEGMHIELPLTFGRAPGMGARYPIKFIYVSNIPVILAAAVLLNIQLMGMFLSNAGLPILGEYQGSQPVGGLAYYTTSLPSPLLITGGYPAYLSYISQPNEILHILVYGAVLILLCVIFGWFWIETTGMNARNVAAQITKTGMQIPGFRQDPRVIEGVLQRYIPVITILGSIFVGALAWFADITGALGTGTGILLTVSILYRFYEDLARQQIFEMYPVLKKIV
jgi:preprotein translocase subunit SecY